MSGRNHIEGDGPQFRAVIEWTEVATGTVTKRDYYGPFATKAAARGVVSREVNHAARMQRYSVRDGKTPTHSASGRLQKTFVQWEDVQ